MTIDTKKKKRLLVIVAALAALAAIYDYGTVSRQHEQIREMGQKTLDRMATRDQTTLMRQLPQQMPGVPAGATASGDSQTPLPTGAAPNTNPSSR